MFRTISGFRNLSSSSPDKSVFHQRNPIRCCPSSGISIFASLTGSLYQYMTRGTEAENTARAESGTLSAPQGCSSGTRMLQECREKETEEYSSSFVEEKDDISQADSFSNEDQSRDLEMDSPRSFSSGSARTNRTKRRRERKRMRKGKRKGKRETTLVLWQKPCDRFVKLNTDGYLKQLEIPSGDSAGEGILRDHEGNVLFAFHEYYGTSCCSA
ncbi:unnamed protein product [Fraxinus pennsylvanica]|uniref:Uncharacterized protein n=1 Tax=Fraxinus pennsylvanica TaxID=56036 RepID=A0AAD1YK69_9LAMI|nr:unnamed protein product [Fraxinus pennsylvanica]